MAGTNPHWDNMFCIILVSDHGAFCAKVNANDAIGIDIGQGIPGNHWLPYFRSIFAGGIFILPEAPVAAVWVDQNIFVIPFKIGAALVAGQEMFLDNL